MKNPLAILPRSFVSRLILVTTLVIVAIVVVQAFVFIHFQGARMRDSVLEEKMQTAELTARIIQDVQIMGAQMAVLLPADSGFDADAFQSYLMPYIVETSADAPDVVYVRLVNPSGEIDVSSIAGEAGTIVETPATNPDETIVVEDEYEGEDLKVAVVPTTEGETVWVGFSLERIKSIASDMKRDVLLGSLAIFVLAAGAAYYLGKRLTRPLKELRAGVEVVSAGDLGYEVTVRARDEVGDLASSFNVMTRKVRGLIELETQARKRSQDIMNTMTEALVVADAEGNIITANKATFDLLGYDEDDLIGQPLKKIMSRKSEKRIRESPVAGFETQLLAEDGKGIEVYLSSSWMMSEEDTPKEVVCVALDLTERFELTRSNVELQEFARIASHDLQEPLRMVMSYVQLLERRYKGKLDADADDFIGFAVDGVDRMQRMINDLLAYSRVDSRGDSFQSTDCAAVLDEARANLQAVIEEAGAVITRDTLPTVVADRLQLVQLFQNLISPRVNVSAEQKGDEWVFSIRDSGIGIDPQYADRIFGVFQRLHGSEEYPGNGIGLAICKKIVERHGGRIWVESQIGNGATFYFTMPIDQEVNSHDQSNDRKAD